MLPPDVNRSGADFTVAEGQIRYGLSAIKACGGRPPGPSPTSAPRRRLPQPLRLLRTARRGHGQPGGRRIAAQGRGLRFDPQAPGQLFAALDRALQAGSAAASDRRSGQKNLFGGDEQPASEAAAGDLPNVPEWPDRERLAKEKEVLGFYLSSHPLAEHQSTLAAYCSHTTTEAAALKHRAEVMLGGMLAAVKFAHTKNPKPGSPSRYAMFDLEDTEGLIRCIVWPGAVRALRTADPGRRGGGRPRRRR